MSRRSPTLRREIVLWFSVVLLVALIAFAGLTYAILRETLRRAGAASLQQTAETAAQFVLPQYIPRVRTESRWVRPPGTGMEALRLRTFLADGSAVDVYVAREPLVEARALRLFVLISLVLIPLTAVAAALGGRSIVDRLLQPLGRLLTATRTMEIGGLARRVEEPARPAELRELASAYNAMLARLERAVDALRRFTADASHELRTPLAVIKGTSQVALSRPRSQGELRDALADVAEEAEWMLHLVEGLLTLTRQEEAADPPPLERVDLSALLADLAETAQALAADKPLTVRMQVPDGLHVRGATGPLRQVFLNLVGNAVKFTTEGRVEVRAETRRAAGGAPGHGADAASCWIRVTVADTGPGIPADEMELVFERFYRGDVARTRQGEGGAGLGLAIARSIVERHGGHLQVRSELGKGSVFIVDLPEPAPGTTGAV